MVLKCPRVLEKEPPEAEKAAAVETLAYKDITPPAKIVAVWAVPEEESLDSNPFDFGVVSGTNPVFVQESPTIPEVVELATVATKREPLIVPRFAAVLLSLPAG
jgi:hypothetical protein